MRTRLIPALLWVVLVVVLGTTTWFATSTFRVIGSLDTMGARGSYVSGQNPDSLAVFVAVAENEFSDGRAPAVGDTVVAIDGQPAQLAEWRELIPRLAEQGFTRQFTVRDGEEEWDVTWTLQPPDTGVRAWNMGYAVLQLGIILLFLGIMGWLLLKQAYLLEAQLLVIFLAGLAATLVFALHFMTVAVRGPNTDLRNIAMVVLFYIAVIKTGAWLHLCLVFPTPARWIVNRRWLVLLLSYGLLVPIMLLPVFKGVQVITTVNLDLNAENIYSTLLNLFQVVLGLIALAVKRKSTHLSSLQRRQVSVILFGAGLGMLMLFILSTVVFAGIEYLQTYPFLGIIYAFLVISSIAIIPISFIYAFGRYRLMEMEARLRRGTRLALINGLLGLMAGVIIALLIDQAQPWMPTDSPAFLSGVAILLAVGLFSGYRKLQVRLERGLFPESQALRDLIEELPNAAARQPNRAGFWAELGGRLRESLGIETMDVAWYADDGYLASEENGLLPLLPGGSLDAHVRQLRKPVPVDEVLCCDRVSLMMEESDWMRPAAANGLLIPLTRQGITAGLLTLRFPERHDGLRPTDLLLVGQLAQQAALQAENLRLMEETVDKQRMAEQLEMAKQVQQGFLPRELPPTPGLDVVAECLSSLEVAGDYYDVIALPEGRTLLAIGDVSGKGAGAAMIMANLQAALRTVADLGHSLAAVVARINEILYRNTTPEQYVTFFAVIYDPALGTVIAVNAGHNPPYLQRRDGSLEEIAATGPILGALSGMPYEETILTLAPGDRLVAYTDGVTEAMNASDEEFGEQRLEQVLQGCRDRSLVEVLSDLKQQVDEFRGEVPLGDDFTVLAIEARGE